ncbi:MAG: hypothetical protein RMK80_09150 [Pseudobdellovibrionaceae bacterium]|nr:hypothetical protein [Pseudobdellovibrionaceae bacterium]
MTALIKRFWQILPPRRRRQSLLLLVLAFLSSLSEMVGIGAVVPFVSLFVNPNAIERYWGMLTEVLPILAGIEPLLLFTVIFIFALLAANSLRALFIWAAAKVSYNMMRDLSVQLYHRALHSPYHQQIQRNSNEVIDQILTKVQASVGSVVLPAFTAVGQGILAMGIMTMLLWYRPGLTLLLATFIGGIYFIIYSFTHKKIVAGSEEYARLSRMKAKLISESLGGIRDVIIDHNFALFEQQFQEYEGQLRRIEGQLYAYSLTPRYLIEFLGMAFLAVYAYLALQGMIPAVLREQVMVTISVLALGAQRLLPIGQQMFAALTQVKGRGATLEELITMVEIGDMKMQPDSAVGTQGMATHSDSVTHPPMQGTPLIALKQVSFRYHDKSPWVFRDMNLSIPRGSRVAICGPPGLAKAHYLI